MKINTTRFGEVGLAKEKIINMPFGIIGFESNTQFAILDFLEKSPMKWLQSTSDPSLAFVVCDPCYFFKDYKPVIEKKEVKELKIDEKDDIVLLTIVSVPSDISKTSLNLLSPIVINSTKFLGKQIILYNSDYKTKHYIFNTVKINKDNLISCIKK
ncbi:MAG: flagellar assembly protein FliW [Actinomycetota bacterium]|nr:flagellar assembly protein FliW [Actinomycetota bacterium]